MEKNKLEIMLTAGLLVIFVLTAANAVRVVRMRTKSHSPAAVSLKAAPAAAMPSEQAFLPEDGDWDSYAWMRCPFSGINLGQRDETAAVSLRLSGILMDAVSPKAIINDDIKGVGDLIGPYTIVKISSKVVTLTDGKNNLELKLE